jgi:hypothetical protein
MKTILAVLVLLAGSVLPASAQTVVAVGGLDSVRWDHVDADLVTTQVVRFELCYDASLPCQTITPAAAKFVPTVAQGGAPATGASAYKMLIPAMTPSVPHTVSVRACNVDICTPMAGALSFRFVLAPGAPTNGQFIKGG